MANKYTITEKQLAFLENYLKRKKNFSNPEDLYELMDHLIVDFETTTTDGNLSQYLSNKLHFIFNYKGSQANKEETIHWAYQKELWSTFFSLFYNLKYIPFTTFAISFLYLLFIRFDFSNKILGIVFICLIIIPMIMGFVLTYHKSKKIRKLVSFKFLSNVMSLPSLFLYMFSMISDYLKENKVLFFTYVLVGVALHFAGIILIHKKRKKILKKHKHLLN